MRYRVIVVCILSFCVWAGCIPTDGGSNAAAAGRKKSTETQAVKKSTSTAPAAKSALTPLTLGGETLKNPGFSEMQADKMVGWAITEYSGKAWAPVKVAIEKKAYGEKSALQLPPAKSKGMVLVQQNVDAAKVKLGKSARFSVMVKTSGASVHAVLAYKQEGKEVKERAISESKKEWQKLEAQCKVPANADPASVKLMVFRFPGDPGEVFVADASLKFEK